MYHAGRARAGKVTGLPPPASPNPALRVAWAAATDTGRRRSGNEDSYAARPDLGLFAVADGMGGHVAGEVASRLSVAALIAAVEATHAASSDAVTLSVDPLLGVPGSRLRDAFKRVSRQLAAAVADDTALRGMATTASAVLVQGEEAAIGHVGDSRIYLARDGRVERLTDDHSWVEEQVRAGMLDRRVAERHPWRNVVTRALSGTDEPVVDYRTLRLQPGDRLLLCSDGLHGVIGEARVADALDRQDADLDALCRRLVDEANAAGGPDNVTLVLLAIHAP
jgi:protein phosphatase